MAKKIGKVEAFYIESNHNKLSCEDIAKDIGCTVNQVSRYVKKLKAAIADLPVANVEEVKKKPVNAKGPSPITSNGVTVMTESAAIHADKVSEMFTNKEWAESVKKCVHNCNT